MVITKRGECFTYNAKQYKVGDYVYANENSDYVGLFGVITEIQTDEDALNGSGNETPNLYCNFNIPMWQEDIEGIQRRFSQLYGTSKSILEICGEVIMDPDMVEVVTELAVDVRDKITKAFSAYYRPEYGDMMDIFADKVVEDVMHTSAYKITGHWNDDDIHLAMGRTFNDILQLINDGRYY